MTSLPDPRGATYGPEPAWTCTRGALHVTLEYEDGLLGVMATHLGLRSTERRTQDQHLLSELQKRKISQARTTVTVLMGVLNEWLFVGTAVTLVASAFQHTPAPASYPCP
jgi:endonuclease/exonuclease/phosphatase family metal-dependent hydrolase